MAYVPNKIKGEDTIYEMVQKINGTMDQLKETDGKVQQTINNLSSHANNNEAHITETERTKWNSKADGNHNHDNVYEKILPAERKRRITFGTDDPEGGSHGDIYFKIQG